MASTTQWTRVIVNSGRWWRTGKAGMMHIMGSQRVGHDLSYWTTSPGRSGTMELLDIARIWFLSSKTLIPYTVMSRLLDRHHGAQGLYLVASEQAGLVRGCAAAAAGEFFSREHFFPPLVSHGGFRTEAIQAATQWVLENSWGVTQTISCVFHLFLVWSEWSGQFQRAVLCLPSFWRQSFSCFWAQTS